MWTFVLESGDGKDDSKGVQTTNKTLCTWMNRDVFVL